MPRNKLKQLIQSLRDESARLPESADETRQRLDSLIAQLDRQIDDSDGDSDGDEDDQGQDIVADVRRAIAQFEVEHPTITGVLNNIMVTLGNMGV